MERIKELRAIVEKGIRREKYSDMYFIEPIQVYLTKPLLLLRMNRIGVSLLWLAVGVASAVLFYTASIGLGMIAVFLHYLQTVLDGCDGQVARYNKRSLDEKDDVRLWALGLYLDYHQHIIIDVLKFGCLALGQYHLLGNPSLLIVALLLIYLRMYKRTKKGFEFRIAHGLRSKKEVLDQIHVDDVTALNRKFLVRILDRLVFHAENGKRVFLWVFVALLIDWWVLPFESAALGTLNARSVLLWVLVVFGLAGVLKEMIVASRYRGLIGRIRELQEQRSG